MILLVWSEYPDTLSFKAWNKQISLAIFQLQLTYANQSREVLLNAKRLM